MCSLSFYLFLLLTVSFKTLLKVWNGLKVNELSGYLDNFLIIFKLKEFYLPFSNHARKTSNSKNVFHILATNLALVHLKFWGGNYLVSLAGKCQALFSFHLYCNNFHFHPLAPTNHVDIAPLFNPVPPLKRYSKACIQILGTKIFLIFSLSTHFVVVPVLFLFPVYLHGWRNASFLFEFHSDIHSRVIFSKSHFILNRDW